MKTKFITGGTGFVGINLIRKLLSEEPSKLVLLVRKNNKQTSEERIHSIFSGYNLENVEVVEGDTSISSLASTPRGKVQLEQKIDEIIHSAASTDMSETERKNTISNNVSGTRNVLDFAKTKPDSVLSYISTAYVAGKREGLVLEDEQINCGFKNPYEESKFLAELLIRESMQTGLKAMIFRPGVIVGHSKTGETQSFNMIYAPWIGCKVIKERHLKESEKKGLSPEFDLSGNLKIPFRMTGRGNSRLNLIPVDSVVDMVYLIGRNPQPGKTFHLTNHYDTTLDFLREQICKALKVSGLEFVNNLPENSTKMEQLFNRSNRVFLPYMTYENPVFDRTNVNAILSDYKIPKPDETLMQTLIKYGESVNWGRRV